MCRLVRKVVSKIYRIVNITDREGNVKQDFIDELHLIHPELVGDILCPEFTKVGGYFCFIWNDDSEKMLRTSTIENYFSNEDTVKVATRNSVYYLKILRKDTNVHQMVKLRSNIVMVN